MKRTLSTAVLACLLVLAAGARLPAQNAEPPRGPATPPRRETAPAGKNLPLADVLADYGKLLGKQIIPDSTVSPTQAIDLLGLDGLAPAQRASLIGKTLFLNGFALVDADQDTVLVLGPGKNPRSVGVPLYTRPDELPADERVFSYLFRLEHRDAIEVAGFLQQYIPPGSAVSFTADVRARTVIATAPTGVMRVVLKVVAALDAAGEPAR